MKAFDQKFGKTFLAALPAQPGIYRVFSESGELIYVGKAKNLRRRLSQYRNAKRRKRHAKMRAIVSEAFRIEHEVCDSDAQAALLEARLIDKLRPRLNVAGAFSFLYPYIGVSSDPITRAVFLCYTTSPERHPEFRFHGAFRSRRITRQAFLSILDLLIYAGHPMKPAELKSRGFEKKDRYSTLAGFRQIGPEWAQEFEAFLKGESQKAMESLVLFLVENAAARRRGREIQDLLNDLRRFWKHEARALSDARKKTAYAEYPVRQSERDQLFLRRRYGLPFSN